MMTMESLEDIHSRMLKAITDAGGRIDGIYVCTSVDDADPMRKPNTGMALRIMKEYPDVSMERSFMIGDQPSDRKFADNCGMEFLLWQ